MTKEEIKEVLRLHQLWLNSDMGGVRANLRCANLRSADLSCANLRSADLSCADLRYANLRSADLRCADLRCADLSKTILENINWLTWIGITVNHKGVGYGYKVINAKGEGIYQGGINYLQADTFEVLTVNPDVYEQCGCGINLATFNWCVANKKSDDNRVLLMEFDLMDGDKPNVICPVASDGKFRVRKCRKVGEVDWQGNLITGPTKTTRDSKGRFAKRGV